MLLREGERKKWSMGSTGLTKSVCPEKIVHVVFGNTPDAHTLQAYLLILCVRSVFAVKTSCIYLSYHVGILADCYFRQSKFVFAYWNLNLWSILCPCFWNTASRITDSFGRLSAQVWGWNRGLFLLHLWYRSRKLDMEKVIQD